MINESGIQRQAMQSDVDLDDLIAEIDAASAEARSLTRELQEGVGEVQAAVRDVDEVSKELDMLDNPNPPEDSEYGGLHAAAERDDDQADSAIDAEG